MIKLIINADDFWYSLLFNKMILELIEEKAIKSTSFMVDEIIDKQEEQIEKLIQFKKKNFVSIWLHIYFKSNNFEEEIHRQFNKYISIFHFQPSHIDIHGRSYNEEVYDFLEKFCIQKNIPYKNFNISGKNKSIITTKTPTFYATRKTFDEINNWIKSLDDLPHCINFHPWYYDLNSKSRTNKEREDDAENIRKIIKNLKLFNIEIISFDDLLNKKYF